MHATERLALALGLALAAPAALAQTTQPAQTTQTPQPAQPARAPQGAPPDPQAYPPAQVAPGERPVGVELHGFASAWWTPWTEPSPTQAREAFRLRFAVLRVDAALGRGVSVLGRLGLTAPGNPLLDLAVTWAPRDEVAVTAGQFRLPLGASVTTLAPQLVMLDRPGYVVAMTKATFRDVGVMLHTSPRGIAGGALHAWLAATSGGGRVGVGQVRAPGPVEDYLWAARVLFSPGRWLFRGPGDRLALGASWARSRDPAVRSASAAADRDLAGHMLGRTVVPYANDRVTQLVGADLTLSLAGVWAQAEALYLHSGAVDGAVTREALGASLELAYTLPVRPFDLANLRLAARGERFDPDLAAAGDELLTAAFGLDVIPAPQWRASAFGQVTRFEAGGQGRTGGEFTLRLAAGF